MAPAASSQNSEFRASKIPGWLADRVSGRANVFFIPSVFTCVRTSFSGANFRHSDRNKEYSFVFVEISVYRVKTTRLQEF